MSTPKRTTTGANVEIDADRRPLEGQFEKARREAREIVEWADRGEAERDARLAREESYAGFKERHAALAQLAEIWYSQATDRERRRAVRSSPVYAALPPEARQPWSELLDATKRLVRGRDGGLTPPARELARRQAQDLERWSPSEPDYDADADLAAIPR